MEVKSVFKTLEDIQFILHEFKGGLAARAIETAYNYGVTIYDVAHAALAELRKAPLSTADGEVVAKVASERVRHLSEFEYID